MKLSISIVAVKKVVSNNSRTEFSEDQLEEVAKLILKAEGVINPIILSRTSLESYEVVDGHFEYYAAVKARELDPRKGEMISAFILEEEKEEAIREQIKAIRKRETSIVVPPDPIIIGFEEKLESLLAVAIGKIKKEIEETLQKEQNQLVETEKKVIQNIKDESKEIKELIQNLQQLLAKNLKLIDDPIKPPGIDSEKPNLITAKKEEVSKALKKVNARENAIDAAYEAIKYWRNKEALTWENLKKSTKDKAHKIPGFGESTYQKLKETTEIKN